MTKRMVDRAIIRAQSTGESFSRGEEYYEDGAVLSLVWRGDALHAEVEGSSYQPYTVTAEFTDAGIAAADCTCPYDWGGWCKHIVAALLACAEEPEKVEERPALSDLLAGLDADQLRALIEKLAQAWPETVEVVERWVALGKVAQSAQSSPAVQTQRPTVTFDLATIRRQVRAAMRQGSDGMDDYLVQVEQLLEGDQARDALHLLEAITESAVSAVDPDGPPYAGGGYRGDYYYDDDDAGSDYYTFFEGMSTLWADSLLSAQLSPDERSRYQEILGGWDEELAGIDWLGADDFFSLGVASLEYYWDYPPLQRVLAGEITERGAWEGEAPFHADALAVVRLGVLERQGRFQEYLHLAEAESQTTLYINMLAKVGRSDEAVAEALQYLSDAPSAQLVAQTLYENGQSAAAFRVAEHGLTTDDYAVYDLAQWLWEKASAAGETRLALHAGRQAVLNRQNLGDYLRLQSLAGEEWSALREELLAKLRQKPSGFGGNAIAIFLHEKLVDDAITALSPYTHDGEVMAVMEAAKESRPDWVIPAAQKKAESIMNAGKADRYIDAVSWLGFAKAAFLAQNRQSEWKDYRAKISEQHGRKWKLMGLLKGL